MLAKIIHHAMFSTVCDQTMKRNLYTPNQLKLADIVVSIISALIDIALTRIE